MNANKMVAEISLIAGTARVVIQEEGLTDQAPEFETDVVFKIATCCDLNKLIFEADNRKTYT